MFLIKNTVDKKHSQFACHKPNIICDLEKTKCHLVMVHDNIGLVRNGNTDVLWITEKKKKADYPKKSYYQQSIQNTAYCFKKARS